MENTETGVKLDVRAYPIAEPKETGAPLLVNGAEVTAEKTFRAVSDAGTVAMEFTFDASALKGKAVVVFETLEYKGKEIAAHADIDDEGQTVTFTEPSIATSAAGPNGEKELNIGSKVTLIDTVSCENLITGKTYTLKLLARTDYLDEKQLSSIMADCVEVKKILHSIVKTTSAEVKL